MELAAAANACDDTAAASCCDNAADDKLADADAPTDAAAADRSSALLRGVACDAGGAVGAAPNDFADEMLVGVVEFGFTAPRANTDRPKQKHKPGMTQAISRVIFQYIEKSEWS